MAIAAVFAAFGLLWIFGSDQLLAALTGSPDAHQQWQTYKGVAFVLAGSGLVYLAVRWFRREEEALIEKLKGSRARLQRAQRVADMGSWELDLETDDLIWSDQIYRIFGTPPEEVGPDYETFLSFVHPEDRERMAAARGW